MCLENIDGWESNVSGSVCVWLTALQTVGIRKGLEDDIGGGSRADLLRLAAWKGQPEDQVGWSLRCKSGCRAR